MSSQSQDKAQDFTVVSARLLRSDRDRLRLVAERDHRTLSGELRYMIEQRLAALPDEDAA